MALPKLLQKLFQNDGAGAKLNESIMPYAYARSVNGRDPDETGNIAVPSRNVGDEWHSFTGQIPVGGVPYCGQEVTRATYADLWAWVQAQGLVKTEDEWQALNTSQNGNVPFYSDGDGSTTFRMPKIVGYVKGASSQSESGSYVAEGLPDITGNLRNNVVEAVAVDGAFVESFRWQNNFAGSESGTAEQGVNLSFRASASNPIYGNSDHVTPETATVLFGVYAFGEITNVGALDADTLATGLATLEAKATTWSPVATVVAFAANSAPSGYLLCNGAAVSRTTYANLFAAIGTTYGEGDGSTTFNLPNLTDKFIQGSGTAGTVKSAGLPNITGTIECEERTDVQFLADGLNSLAFNGSFYHTGTTTRMTIGNGSNDTSIKGFGIDASRSSSIYGNSDTVQPPALTMRYYIKY